MLLVEPRQRLVRHQIVRVFIFISHGLTNDALASLPESWEVVIRYCGVESEVIVPISLPDTLLHMHLADDRDLISGLVKEIGKNWNVRRQCLVWMMIGIGARPSRLRVE